MFVVVIIFLALLLALVVAVTIAQRRDPGRADEAGLRIVQWFSLGVAAAIAVLAVVQSLRTGLGRGPVRVSVPVAQTWPTPPPGVTVTEGPTATRVAGGFTEADLSLTGLSPTARWLLAGGTLLTAIAVVVIALLLADLCRRLRAAEPFADRLRRLSLSGAVVVLVAGLGGQLLTGLGELMAGEQALRIRAWGTKDESLAGLVNAGLPEPLTSLQVSFWPIVAAVVMVAVAELVRRGASISARAQRLGEEADQLRQDTRGLV